MLGLVGDSALDTLTENLNAGDPGPAREIAMGTIDQVRDSTTTAGLAVIVGIAGALWSASSYVGGFMRASGVIHGLAAVIGFFIWLWLSNAAMLYGAELNAVLESTEDG